MDSVLRPRDIQARIRAGESPETVAEAAQTTVDKIMGFATPVLAERAYVAQQAQKASVRRRAADGPAGQLGDAVASRLADQEVEPEDVEWDAWRREDGRWTLVATFAAGGRSHRAEFAYDAAGRYVVAEDDQARALVGERSGAGDTEQLPLGDDAIELVTGRRPAPPAEEPTVDLTETAAAVRPPDPLAARSVQPVAADWISTQATERPARAPDAVPSEHVAQAEQVENAPQPVTGSDEGGTQPTGRGGDPGQPDEQALFEASEVADRPGGTAADTDGDQDPEQPSAQPRKPPKAKSKGRASVPSWDEIMFGSGRGD